MAISSNSIIHYTEQFDVLCKILKDGFKIKYCGEKLKLKGYKGSYAAHPMVSFCDIPLTESAAHFQSYGFYGIGLYKKWACEKKLNPVLYIEENSSVAKLLAKMLNSLRHNNSGDVSFEIYLLKAFSKNYSGKLKTSKRNETNYIFYNEREWRYVPDKKKINNELISIALSKYNEDKEKYNDKISQSKLGFEPKDISYIIVEKIDEIPKIVKYIKDIYEDKCTAKELDILLTKICSTEQILSDY